jgi:predicted PurR-regulated permease PerM
VEEIAAVLPVSEAAQEEVAQAITTAVRGVFESALKLAAFHVGLTWLLLSVTGVTRLLGLSMLAAAALSVLPAPPALVILPAVIQLAAQVCA